MRRMIAVAAALAAACGDSARDANSSASLEWLEAFSRTVKTTKCAVWAGEAGKQDEAVRLTLAAADAGTIAARLFEPLRDEHPVTYSEEFTAGNYVGRIWRKTHDDFFGGPWVVYWTDESPRQYASEHFEAENCALLGYAAPPSPDMEGWVPLGSTVAANDSQPAGTPWGDDPTSWRDAPLVSQVEAAQSLMTAAGKCLRYADQAEMSDERERLLGIAHDSAIVLARLAPPNAAHLRAAGERFGVDFYAGYLLGEVDGSVSVSDQSGAAAQYSRANCELIGHEARESDVLDSAAPLEPVPLE